VRSVQRPLRPCAHKYRVFSPKYKTKSRLKSALTRRREHCAYSTKTENSVRVCWFTNFWLEVWYWVINEGDAHGDERCCAASTLRHVATREKERRDQLGARWRSALDLMALISRKPSFGPPKTSFFEMRLESPMFNPHSKVWTSDSDVRSLQKLEQMGERVRPRKR